MRAARLLVLGWAVVMAWGCKGGEAQVEVKTEEDKTFYALGIAVSEGLGPFKGQLTEVELKLVLKGLADGAMGRTPVVKREDYMTKLGELAQKRGEAGAAAEKAKGQAYLDNAAGESGAVRTTSGMVYKELVAGTGAQPKPTDKVKVHYTGYRTDGKEFDSSVKRGEPAVFPLDRVIKGWSEGVGMMKVGGKARLVVPPEMGYGDRGQPQAGIPAGSTLVFEVELISIE